MTKGNGSTMSEAVEYSALAPAIASSITAALRGAARSTSSPASAAPSWLMFATALDKLVASSLELRRAIEEAVARTARAALATGEGALPPLHEFLTRMRSPEVAARGGTVARAFWWGFHVQISHEDLDAFVIAAAPINIIIGAIEGGIPSPATPFIAAAAAFVADALGLLKSLDRGSGVYVSMSWFAPFVFVPTTV